MKEKKMFLDDEEIQVLTDFEKGEFESIQNFHEEKSALEKAAKTAFSKDKRINPLLCNNEAVSVFFC